MAVNPDGGIAGYVPAPRPNVEALPRRHAGLPYILRSTDGLAFAEVSERELDLWKLVDGKRTLEQLGLAALSWPTPAGLEWVGATVAKLARGRLITNPEVTLERKSRLLVRFFGPMAPGKLERPLAIVGRLIFSGLGTLGLMLTALAVFVRGVSLMPPGSGPWSLLGAAWLVLQMAELARAAAYLSLSRPLEHVGLRLGWGFPVFSFDPPELSPVEHKRAAVWGFLAQYLVSGAAAFLAIATDSPVGNQMVAVTLVLALLDLSPFLAADGLALLVALTQDARVRERMIRFAKNRLLTRLFSREPWFHEEKKLLMVTACAAVWAAGALRFGTYLVSTSLSGFTSAINSQAGWATWIAGLAILLGAVGSLLAGFLAILVLPIRLIASMGLRGEEVARWMFPMGLVAAAIVWAIPFEGPVLAAYFLLTIVALRLLFQQLMAIPGSRLSRAYIFLWLALAFHTAHYAPLVFASLGAFDLALLPSGYLAVTSVLAPAGYCAFAVLVLLEAASSRFRPARWGLAAGPLAIVASQLPRAPSFEASLVMFALALLPSSGVLLWLDRRKTPMRNYWRPFAVAALLLTVAALTSTAPRLLVEGLRLHVAGLTMLVAGLLATRAMFAVPMPVLARPEGHRSGGSTLEALYDAGAHLLSNMLGIATFFLGEDRAAKIVDSFNRTCTTNSAYPIRFEGKSLTPDSIELPEVMDLATSLRRGLDALERELVASAGRNFYDRALTVSSEGLYWLEWEQAHEFLFSQGASQATKARLLEEVARIPLFRNLTPAQLEELVRVLRREKFDAGQPIVKQGEEGDRFYVVSRGHLEVVREDELGHPARLARLGPGDCFGELALIGDGKRAATVLAETSVEVISLVRDDFERFVPDRENVTSVIRHGGFLMRIPFFSQLPASLLSRLAGRLEETSHAQGTTLARANEKMNRILMVKEGAVASAGAEHGPGSMLGQEPVAAADVRTVGPSVILWLDRADIGQSVREWLNGFASVELLARRLGSAGWTASA